MPMLKQKYIQYRFTEAGRDEYLVLFPASMYPTRTYRVVGDLDEAIKLRNTFLGYDPDVGTEVPMTNYDARNVTMGEMVRFGVLGDNHFGSKYERLDVVHALYQIYAAHNITAVYHTGNWIEGEASFNKDDINIFGVDNQFDYLFRKYPKHEGMTTYFVGGDDHEGWYTKKSGINLATMWRAKQAEHGRYDMVYLGYMEADVEIPLPGSDDPLVVRVVHPGGGSAKSISLSSQNIVDSWHPDEYVDLLLVGHYHKSHLLPDYKGVAIVQTGTGQDKTPFMKKNRLAVHIGGWIVSAGRMSDGGLVISGSYIPFKANRWRYRANVAPKFLAPDDGFDFDNS
jgi:hypothetical protein